MNPLLLKEVQVASSKMGAYYGLLEFRYKNLCVKADPFSLLPVTVKANLYECNIEEVASIEVVNDFQLAIYPDEESYLEDIAMGVMKAHPEFKQQFMVRPHDDGEDQELKPEQIYDADIQGFKFLLYTMPKVDKNRYDLLTNGANSLHDECVSKIKVVNMQTQTKLTDGSFISTQKEMDEAEKELKELYDTSIEKADQLLEDKLDEIQEAYQHYQETDAFNEEGEESGPGYDVSHGMRMGGTVEK